MFIGTNNRALIIVLQYIIYPNVIKGHWSGKISFEYRSPLYTYGYNSDQWPSSSPSKRTFGVDCTLQQDMALFKWPFWGFHTTSSEGLSKTQVSPLAKTMTSFWSLRYLWELFKGPIIYLLYVCSYLLGLSLCKIVNQYFGFRF